MEVTLMPQLEEFVQEQVAAGRYDSPGHVLNAALMHLRQTEESGPLSGEEINRALAVADEQIAQGLYETHTKETLSGFFDGVEAEARSRREARRSQAS